MSLTIASIIALAGLSAAGFTTWLWLAVAQVTEELRTFDNFEGMHLEA